LIVQGELSEKAQKPFPLSDIELIAIIIGKGIPGEDIKKSNKK